MDIENVEWQFGFGESVLEQVAFLVATDKERTPGCIQVTSETSHAISS